MNDGICRIAGHGGMSDVVLTSLGVLRFLT
jgi:hypothetical protein